MLSYDHHHLGKDITQTGGGGWTVVVVDTLIYNHHATTKKRWGEVKRLPHPEKKNHILS